jgi:hypothetical protein
MRSTSAATLTVFLQSQMRQPFFSGTNSQSKIAMPGHEGHRNSDTAGYQSVKYLQT